MKTCPNCNKEVPSNSKFCTFCGFNFFKSDYPSNINRKLFVSFYQWFLLSIKTPNKNTFKENNYFGLVSFGLSFLLFLSIDYMSIPYFLNLAKKYIAIGGGWSTYHLELYKSGISKDSINGIILGMSQFPSLFFYHSLLAFISTVIFTILIGFGFIKYVCKKQECSLLSYINKVAFYSNFSILFEMLTLILLLLGSRSTHVLFLTFIFIPIIYLIGSIYAVKSLIEVDNFAFLIALFLLEFIVIILSIYYNYNALHQFLFELGRKYISYGFLTNH